jgi:glycosyltransferase involved in cell wall biosynthesis
MRIHVYSHRFPPDVGGMERLIATLCDEFVRQGHDVEVVTETRGEMIAAFPIHRAPTTREYIAMAKRADVILSAPLSLRRLLPQLASRKPICVAHPLIPLVIYPGVPVKVWWRRSIPHAIKRLAAFLVTNIVPSRHMAKYFPKAIAIPNPFDEATFAANEAAGRGRDLLFAGRLVVEKGCDVLLEAFARIAPDQPGTNLTVIGDGPKRAELEEWAARHGIADRVEFRGNVAAPAVAEAMRSHLVLVVPSLVDEAFGIVALEGLACGARVIVTRAGGLPDAVGDVGLSFERGDVDGLVHCLRQVLDEGWAPPAEGVAQHLSAHRPAAIARHYLDVLEAVAKR